MHESHQKEQSSLNLRIDHLNAQHQVELLQVVQESKDYQFKQSEIKEKYQELKATEMMKD